MTIWKDEQLITVLKGWSKDSEYWAEGLLGLHEETGKTQLKTAGEHIREASRLMKELVEGLSKENTADTALLDTSILRKTTSEGFSKEPDR